VSEAEAWVLCMAIWIAVFCAVMLWRDWWYGPRRRKSGGRWRL